eukprot:TRINITY_DN917_c0_g1_i4.p1 TRINITY_DN917_c0_g1~~TRINITY_DN917_c0_g1_i4.p1  ORF type:complete len:174 (+),score=41.19 TRINITY_DN917_c0_g1_i4:366-887(+)
MWSWPLPSFPLLSLSLPSSLLSFLSPRPLILPPAHVLSVTIDECGGGVIITDFCPRFKHLGRTFRPVQIVRILTPFSPEEGDDNMTRVRVNCRPLSDYGADKPQRTRGSNHIRYIGGNNTLRLTTNCPVSYVYDEIPFVLEKECYLILGPDESISDTPKIIAQRFLGRCTCNP